MPSTSETDQIYLFSFGKPRVDESGGCVREARRSLELSTSPSKSAVILETAYNQRMYNHRSEGKCFDSNFGGYIDRKQDNQQIFHSPLGQPQTPSQLN